MPEKSAPLPPPMDSKGESSAAATVEAAPADQASEASSQSLQAFIQGTLDKKRQRKHQLDLIQKFFDDPTAFGIDAELIPHVTNQEELATQKQYLEYRITLLRSILEVMEGELKLLSEAQQQADAPETG